MVSSDFKKISDFFYFLTVLRPIFAQILADLGDFSQKRGEEINENRYSSWDFQPIWPKFSKMVHSMVFYQKYAAIFFKIIFREDIDDFRPLPVFRSRCQFFLKIAILGPKMLQ